MAKTKQIDLRAAINAISDVTSRFDSDKPKTGHYALICSSQTSLLDFRDVGDLDMDALKNLLTGRPVGASQVTAIVQHLPKKRAARKYPAILRAKLESPFLVRLRCPIAICRVARSTSWNNVTNEVWSNALQTKH